jgi:murein DD-endopeptidase MepM/ murein hydrolase activator NlpD
VSVVRPVKFAATATVALCLLSIAGWLAIGKAAAETGYTLPFYASYYVNCPFGVSYASCGRPELPGDHQGIDYDVGQNGNNGEVIAAAAAGTAKFCPEVFPYGKFVLIDQGGQNRTLYLHLDGWGRPSGSTWWVGRGEVVGYEGTTGN